MFAVSPLPRTLEAGRRDLTHASPRVRLDAARDLARVPEESERALRAEALSRALKDPDAAVRKRVILSLADLEVPSVVPSLLPMLGDADLGVRQMAIIALGELAAVGDEDVSGRLRSLLGAGAPALRYQALIAVTRLCPESAADDLLQALGDADAEIRELALRLIDENIVQSEGSSEPGSARDQEATTERGAAGVRARLDPATSSALRHMTEDQEPAVRALAQLYCADYDIDARREMIEAIVARRQRVREPRDEQLAIQLTGKLGLTSVTGFLRGRAFGLMGISFDPFRWDARAALARLGDARAMSLLEKNLESKSWLRRTYAVHAVGWTAQQSLLPRLLELRGHASSVDQEVLEEAIARLEAAR